MKRKKILEVCNSYKKMLEEKDVEPKRWDVQRPFSESRLDERMSHALYLIGNISSFDPQRQYDKLNRHFTAIQMCLSFAGMFTLEDLMSHNRSA